MFDYKREFAISRGPTEALIAQQAEGDAQVATSLPYALLVKGPVDDGGPDDEFPLTHVGPEEPGSNHDALMMNVDAVLGKWFPLMGRRGTGVANRRLGKEGEFGVLEGEDEERDEDGKEEQWDRDDGGRGGEGCLDK